MGKFSPKICGFETRPSKFDGFSLVFSEATDDLLVEVEVEFDYEAELGDELTIKTGEIIKDVKRMDGGWWEGNLNGRRGVFPDNFVKVRHIFVN